MKTGLNSIKAFRYALLSIAAFLIFVLIKALVGAEKIAIENYDYISILTMFFVIAFSFMGFIYSMKSLKEPNNFKKIAALVINSILMILFIATTIANGIDIINYMKST